MASVKSPTKRDPCSKAGSTKDIARIDSTKIKGIITSSGGVVSHAAILARSLLIPAICVSEASLHEIHEGDMLAVNGGMVQSSFAQ